MNREIEFRGKRLDNGKWIYGDLIYTKNDLGIITDCRIVEEYNPHESYIDGWAHRVNPETVGQFTEKHGERKEEIFDGDIVKWTSLYIEGEAIGEVTFFEGCWFIQGEKHNGQLNDCLTCEVIGNIYDNQRAPNEA